jgi:integrase/recombinase XerD
MNEAISLSSAIDGYFLAARARQLSPCTLRDYATTFRKFSAFLEKDPEVARLSSKDIEGFVLQQTTVSKKTILNYLIGLSAFFHWASDENLIKENIFAHVQKPKPEKPVINELSDAGIKALLAALERSAPTPAPGKSESSHRLPCASRNRAILLLLLDTGMRASEICSLKIARIEVRNSRLKIYGKGNIAF